MIAQNIGLEYLIPNSIEKLSEDLLISGDLYDGDLLQAVLNVKFEFWEENVELKEKIENLVADREEKLEMNKIKFEKFRDRR